MDVVLTNIPGTRATVSPAIADHRLVTAELAFKVPEQTTLTRTVLQFAKADWEMMRDMLSTQPWEDMLEMNASDAADFLGKTIQESAEHCFPRRELRERKSTHPWLTAETDILVKEKNDAEGTPLEREAAEKCSAGILAGFLEYTRKCAKRLRGWFPSGNALCAKLKELQPYAQNFKHICSEICFW